MGLSKKDVDIFNDKQSQIGKLFEKQKMDLIEKHTMQLKEKEDFDKSGEIDDTLKSKLDEINSLLEMKTQEIEELKTKNDDLVDEKIRLESKMAEIEQFRQEVAKEANQHMEETGDKMRE